MTLNCLMDVTPSVKLLKIVVDRVRLKQMNNQQIRLNRHLHPIYCRGHPIQPPSS
jgi:hypothetical protein